MVKLRAWAVAAGCAITLAAGGTVLAATARPDKERDPKVHGAPAPALSQSGAEDSAQDRDFTVGPATATGTETGGAFGAAPIGSTRYPVPAGAYFVAPSGDDQAAGSEEAPWRTVANAIRRVPSDAVIVLRAGTYHESAQVDFKKITLQPYPGEAVWFDGSGQVTGWVKDGAAWRKDGWTASFDATDPTAANADPDWRMVDPRYPMSRFPDQVFLNGRELDQVESRGKLRPGTFYVDTAARRLYLGSNPDGARVDATDLAEALYLNHANGSVVRGIGFRRYATPLLRYGAVKAIGDDLLLENNVVADTATIGLMVRGSRITVRRNSLLRNGRLGLNAYRTAGVTVTGNAISENNTQRFRVVPEAGGFKITHSTTPRIVGNRTDANAGTGIWLDESVADAVVARNLSRGNTGHGIQFEISDGALIAGNVAVDNTRHGIRINEASRARLWNNTAAGNRMRQIDLIDGGRRGTGRMSFDTTGIELRNNLMEARPDGGEPLGVEDLTHRHGAEAMTTADGNAYYRPRGRPGVLAHWVDRSGAIARPTDLAAFRSQSGQEAHGIAADTEAPFVDRRFFARRPGSPPTRAGLPVPADVAAAIGTEAGARPGIGAPASF